MKNYNEIISNIQNNVKQYIINNNLQALIIGVSGGFDSGLGCALLAPICRELGIPLIGRYIHIESNSNEEKTRAKLIGNAFCTDFRCKDLTSEFFTLLTKAEEPSIFGGFSFIPPKEQSDKIRRGNVKVRLRMIYLYNMAQYFKGVIIGCNNLTEQLLGFFTLGDSGDVQPFISLYKTELYELAKVYLEQLKTDEEKIALQSVIDAVPTDGLGITSSDVEQFGVNTYDEVDDILMNLKCYQNEDEWDEEIYPMLCSKYTQESVDKVINRHKNSEFKQNYPYKVIL